MKSISKVEESKPALISARLLVEHNQIDIDEEIEMQLNGQATSSSNKDSADAQPERKRIETPEFVPDLERKITVTILSPLQISPILRTPIKKQKEPKLANFSIKARSTTSNIVSRKGLSQVTEQIEILQEAIDALDSPTKPTNLDEQTVRRPMIPMFRSKSLNNASQPSFTHLPLDHLDYVTRHLVNAKPPNSNQRHGSTSRNILLLPLKVSGRAPKSVERDWSHSESDLSSRTAKKHHVQTQSPARTLVRNEILFGRVGSFRHPSSPPDKMSVGSKPARSNFQPSPNSITRPKSRYTLSRGLIA